MQIQLFSIPVIGGESLSEEMNRFLRAHKVLTVEQSLTGTGDQALWCFCIKYLDSVPKSASAGTGRKPKVDYKELLDDESFARIAHFREIRKQLADEEVIPAYAVFTNAELAEMAKIPELTLMGMKAIKGIGEKKASRYGQHFVITKDDEEGREAKG